MYVNRPSVSRWISLFYILTAVFLGVLGIWIALAIPKIGLLVSIVIAAIDALILYLIVSIYRTRYILTEDEILIKAPILVGGSKKIRFKEVREVQRTFVPFGLRLFGASFYGGYYHIPSLGRTFMLITNYSDGVLIRTDKLNYIITPSNPDKFIERFKAKMYV